MFHLTITQLENGNKLRENNYVMQMFVPPCCTFMLIMNRKTERLQVTLPNTVCKRYCFDIMWTCGLSGCVFWD